MISNAQRAFNCPRINLVRPGGLHHMWPHYEKWIDEACSYSLLENETSDTMRQGILEGRLLLAEIGSDEGALACAILTVIDTTEGQALHVIALGGEEMHLWLDDFIVWLRATAKGLNCTAGVTLTGRPGWVRELKKYGFEYLYCNMRMPAWLSE